MMSQDTPRLQHDVAEAAAQWIVRRDGGSLSEEDEAAFRLWLADPDNRAAFERLQGVWGVLDGVFDGSAKRPALPVRRRFRFRRAGSARPVRPVRRSLGAVAAALALLVIGGSQDWVTWLRADYATDVGERRSARLPDGSMVQLDSRSAIALDFSGKRRVVRLLAGTAMFEVAPDKTRPFTVEADSATVTALGTAFVVRRRGDRTSIAVTEHSVRLVSGRNTMIVREGQQADYGAGMLRGPMPADRNATAWARGRLIAANRPLRDVVEEIGRYRHGYMVVSGPAASLRVSGVYDLDDPVAAINSIQQSLGLTSFRLTDRVIILSR